MKRLTIAAFILLALATLTTAQVKIHSVRVTSGGGGGGGGSPNLYTGVTNGTLRNNYTGSVGSSFRYTAGSVTVDALCRWKVSGNSQTHTLYLVNVSVFAIISSVSVDMSTGSAGTWICTNLGSPQSLTVGTTYGILSTETNGGDQWYDDDSTVGGVFTNVVQDSSIFDATPPVGTGGHSAAPAIYVPVNAVVH